jgi:hypothetical protein
VQVEFTPEPSPEERDALLHALAALDGPDQDGSAWWQAGIRESVEEEAEGSSAAWPGDGV